MDGGLLSLKWNNHRSTFLHVLSTVRHKESYCDVTIACDGKFYPVHKLVLSTCSEYFEQMFERTACRHPIIVLKDIRKEDLEALLNYMYVGEVNVLQNNLSGLIKAAEGLRIKGLAVPDESPSEGDAQDAKRCVPWGSEGPDSKRRRPEEQPSSVHKSVHGGGDKGGQERSSGYREPFRIPSRSREANRGAPASPSPSPVTPGPDTHLPSASVAETPPELLHPASRDLPAPPLQPSGSNESNNSSNESMGAVEQEVKLDEPLVKEEPQETYSEPDETKDTLQAADSDPPSLTYSQHSGSLVGGEAAAAAAAAGPGGFTSQPLRPTNQPQTLEELVALPSASGLQGKSLWEGDRALLGIPYEGYSASQPRGSQMGPRSRCGNQGESLEQTLARAIQSAHVCPICGHLARQKKDLKKHLRIHTGEKPYACPWCVYRSTQNSNLRTHIRRVHTQHVLPLVDQQQPALPGQGEGDGTGIAACPRLSVD